MAYMARVGPSSVGDRADTPSVGDSADTPRPSRADVAQAAMLSDGGDMKGKSKAHQDRSLEYARRRMQRIIVPGSDNDDAWQE